MRIVNALIHIHVQSIEMVMYPEQAASSVNACSAQMLGTDNKLLGITNKIQ